MAKNAETENVNRAFFLEKSKWMLEDMYA